MASHIATMMTMREGNEDMKNIKLAITLTSLLLVSLNIEAKDYQGRSCELDGATTESGEQVTGEWSAPRTLDQRYVRFSSN